MKSDSSIRKCISKLKIPGIENPAFIPDRLYEANTVPIFLGIIEAAIKTPTLLRFPNLNQANVNTFPLSRLNSIQTLKGHRQW